jgi:phage-related protein
MAKYFQFTIPSTDFTELTSNYIITADRGFSRQVAFNILTASFGDGYEQRAENGINSKQEQISLSFNNRYYREGNLIAAFFDLKKASNFLLKVTNTKDVEDTSTVDVEENIRVTCDSYNIVYPTEDLISIQTTLRRVYEPAA